MQRSGRDWRRLRCVVFRWDFLSGLQPCAWCGGDTQAYGLGSDVAAPLALSEGGEAGGGVGVDGEEGVHAGHLEERGDLVVDAAEAHLAVELHGEAVGVDDGAEACGVDVGDAGEIEDDLDGAGLDEVLEVGVGGVETGAEGEGAGHGDDGGVGCDVLGGDIENHGRNVPRGHGERVARACGGIDWKDEHGDF